MGANSEDSAATGIDGDQTDRSALTAGAVYIFTRSGSTWTQQSYVKAFNTDAFDAFGSALALAGDGSTLAVGAPNEASAATGVGGDSTNDMANRAGAVYTYKRVGTTWVEHAYIKASNTELAEAFGAHVALSRDGVDADQTDNSKSAAGAVYVFK